MKSIFENMVVQADMKEICSNKLIKFSEFKNKTFLITGATGMLPSYLVFVLIYLNEIDPGYNIQIIVPIRNRTKAEQKFGHYLSKSYFHILNQNICDEFYIDGPVDYIIHGASLASPQFYGVNPVETLLPNILGTYRLLELAKEKKTRGFLFFSSGEVYGNVENLKSIGETDFGYLNPVDIRSCYGESKRMGENMCASWFYEYGVCAKSVRIYHTYGPTMDIENDKRVFSEFVANVVHKENIVIKSDGSPVRSFCYISDATAAFFLVLLTGINGESYNVANPECMVSMRDLAQILVSIKPELNLKIVESMRLNDNNYIENKRPNSVTANITKMRNLGWEPKISIEEGFSRTIDSCIPFYKEDN